MYKLAENVDISQISLTGVRAILLLCMLSEKPRSLNQIHDIFLQLGIIEEKSSLDIIRIDINTLKAMGCEISRADSKTNYKYVLTNNPFSLKLTKEEVGVLKKVYKSIRETNDIKTLIEYDKLLTKIISYVCDEETKNWLTGILSFKRISLDIAQDILLASKNNYTIELKYATPTLKNVYIKQVVAQRVVLKNNKLYLYCYDLNKKVQSMLNIERIIELCTFKIKKDIDVKIKSIQLRFLLSDIDEFVLEDGEKIVQSDENGYIIEGEYFNNFVAMQRVLSLGDRCTVLSPDNFKEFIIKKLKEMRGIYE